jgi:holin-like protein
MLAGLTWLLIFQCIGEVTVRLLQWPIPGPVLGMVLLLLTLHLRGGEVKEEWRQAAQGLLSHLSLLFVPAGVGVMLYWRQITQEWLAICVALVVSTLLALLCTAYTMQWLMRRRTTLSAEKDTP